MATEFGREKIRPPGAADFGSSLSPMARGNTILGGVDADTGLTFGFDPITGRPEPGRTMTEAEIFSGLLEIMGVPKSGSGLPSVPIMARV